jgi:hypothetical protein
MNNLAELRAQAQRMMNDYPIHKSEIVDLYNSAITKIMNGGNEPDVCTHMLAIMLELVGE